MLWRLTLAVSYLFTATLAKGYSTGPGLVCGALHPGTIAFIGKPLLRDSRGGTVFHISEPIWGLGGISTITVVVDGGYSTVSSERFIAAAPGWDGRYQTSGGGLGVMLPVDDPAVRNFRGEVRNQRRARMEVQVYSAESVPVEGAHIRLTGKPGIFEARVGSGFDAYLSSFSLSDFSFWSIFDTIRIPPGEYEVTATRPGFILDDSSRRVSIPPGSCAALQLKMNSVSRVTGRMLTPDGRPAANAFIRLQGLARWGWRERRASSETTTDAQGYFSFASIYPGHYFLFDHLAEIGHFPSHPLPNTFYPGVHHWRKATRLEVEEGHSVEGLTFQVPDFGKPRRLEVMVVDGTNTPVPGAFVGDGSLDMYDEQIDNLDFQRSTDSDGRVSLEIWPIYDYELRASFWPRHGRMISATTRLPAGADSARVVIKLPGLRLARR